MRHLPVRMNVRISEEDSDRIDRLAATTPLRRGQLARELMRLGAELVEQDPTRLLRRGA